MADLRERAIRAVRGDDELAKSDGWHTGMCWLGCGERAVQVKWVANARTKYGDVPVTGCAPCQNQWQELAWIHLTNQDIADLSAR